MASSLLPGSPFVSPPPTLKSFTTTKSFISSTFPATRNPNPAPLYLDPTLSRFQLFASKMEAATGAAEEGPEASAAASDGDVAKKKKIFVAGSTGKTGRRIVKQLLSMGFAVRAGALDVEKARTSLPRGPGVEIVSANVTESPEKLAEAIGDAEAVICATGFRRSLDFFAPWKVDNFGTVNLVEACRKVGVKRFILISSILVNGAAMGQLLNPAYIILNVFGFTLIAKLQAEQYIRRSGINYTIVRPGGLRDDPPTGSIVMEPEDTLSEGSISRDQVAEVAVEALFCPESFYKTVEIVARAEAPKKSIKDLFIAINQK